VVVAAVLAAVVLAAPPAAAMIAFTPRLAAAPAHSATACGVRCADMAFAS